MHNDAALGDHIDLVEEDVGPTQANHKIFSNLVGLAERGTVPPMEQDLPGSSSMTFRRSEPSSGSLIHTVTLMKNPRRPSRGGYCCMTGQRSSKLAEARTKW